MQFLHSYMFIQYTTVQTGYVFYICLFVIFVIIILFYFHIIISRLDGIIRQNLCCRIIYHFYVLTIKIIYFQTQDGSNKKLKMIVLYQPCCLIALRPKDLFCFITFQLIFSYFSAALSLITIIVIVIMYNITRFIAVTCHHDLLFCFSVTIL